MPTATAPSGQAVSFSITNKPAWATFSSTTGSLSGTPSASNVGPDNNIEIGASTPASSAALPAFTIMVSAPPPPPPTIATPVFSFANFSSNPNSIDLGDAEGFVGGAIQLAGNQVHDAGQAWYKTKQDITSFTTDFTFKITSNGYGDMLRHSE